jgi:hypothetical protein
MRLLINFINLGFLIVSREIRVKLLNSWLCFYWEIRILNSKDRLLISFFRATKGNITRVTFKVLKEEVNK